MAQLIEPRPFPGGGRHHHHRDYSEGQQRGRADGKQQHRRQHQRGKNSLLEHEDLVIQATVPVADLPGATLPNLRSRVANAAIAPSSAVASKSGQSNSLK